MANRNSHMIIMFCNVRVRNDNADLIVYLDGINCENLCVENGNNCWDRECCGDVQFRNPYI